MNTLEDRLRDAYRAAADTIHPETVLPGGPGLPSDGHRRPAHRGRRGRSRTRMLIPLTAAAAVTAVAVAASLLAQQAAPRAVQHGQRTHNAVPPAGTPPYFVALNWTTPPHMIVVNAATGAAGQRVNVPFPAGQLHAVATGDGRTFVVAAGQSAGCGSTLYRFTLSPSGIPGPLKRFTTLPASIGDPWDMAVSGNGQTVAYLAVKCGRALPTTGGVHMLSTATLDLLNTATGKTRRWSVANSLNGADDNLTMTPDGSEVGLGTWVLPTSAPQGPISRYGRQVYHPGEFGTSVIMSSLNVAQGSTVYFSTFHVRSGKPVWGSWQLRAFDLATGQTSLVRNFHGTPGTASAAAPDPTGRYLLVQAVPSPQQAMTWDLYRLDVATGRMTQLKSGWAIEPGIAW